MAQMKLPAVLELMHERAHDAATPIAGNGRVEIEATMRAVCAGEIAADRAGKLLRALLAKRRFDARRFLLAFGQRYFPASTSAEQTTQSGG